MTATPTNHSQSRINPYVGPRAFRTGEALYGRDREVEELLDLLIAERIVLLYSPSGAGKTSLVQAALIPRLQEEDFFIHPPMRVNTELPVELASNGRHTNRFVYSALLSIEEKLPPDLQTPLDDLARAHLLDYLLLRLWQIDPGEPKSEVLIFDQFEEIVTVDPTNEEDRVQFFTQLGQSLRDKNRWALFSMREDFIATLDPYVRYIPTRFGTTFRLDLLGAEAGRAAAQEPARRAGVNFDEAAARKLVNDLRRVRIQRADGAFEERPGPHIEPVQLQVVCYRMWDQLPPGAAAIGEA
ncbi:MAG: ATP-binding protein, partial [Burkholderiales bacterium]